MLTSEERQKLINARKEIDYILNNDRRIDSEAAERRVKELDKKNQLVRENKDKIRERLLEEIKCHIERGNVNLEIQMGHHTKQLLGYDWQNVILASYRIDAYDLTIRASVYGFSLDESCTIINIPIVTNRELEYGSYRVIDK